MNDPEGFFEGRDNDDGALGTKTDDTSFKRPKLKVELKFSVSNEGSVTVTV